MKKLSLLIFALFLGTIVSFSQVDTLEYDISDEEQLLLEQAFAQMFGSNVDVKDHYDFDFAYKIKVESTGMEDVEMEDMEILLNLKDKVMSVCSSMKQDGKEMDMTMIYLWESKEMINLSEYDGQKFGMSMVIPDMEEIGMIEEVKDEDEDDKTWVKTGKTEVIAGHKCTIYESDDDLEIVRMWISNEKNVIPQDAFEAFSDVNGRSAFEDQLPAEGSILKMWSQYKGAEGYETYEVIEISPNKKTTISTEGYDFDLMNMQR